MSRSFIYILVIVNKKIDKTIILCTFDTGRKCII